MKPSPYSTEDNILLGGKVSHLHQEYKKLAQCTPGYSKVIYILENLDELLNQDPIKLASLILENFGKIDNLQRFGEITILSMIVGDPRMRKSGKNLREVLNAKLHNIQY